MILKEIKQLFHKELDTIYGEEEVDSFFYLSIEHFFGLNRLTLALQPNYIVTKAQEQPLLYILDRLKLEEPIQYILGETEFYGLQFNVNKYTLIPRSETEELVSWILKDTKDQGADMNILDIGTGSGCIAITVAKYLPKANVFALDISKEALQIAKKNADLNQVDVTFIADNILNSQHNFQVKFDVIVSNPPYVRHLEKNDMKNNVLQHEPQLALFVEDNDPLVFYRAIAGFAVNKLKTNGKLFFEINQYLGQEMLQLLETFSFENLELKQDIFENDRMIKASRILWK